MGNSPVPGRNIVGDQLPGTDGDSEGRHPSAKQPDPGGCTVSNNESLSRICPRLRG